jgi:hypothetical protein
MESYVKTLDQSQSVDGMVSFRNQTGGFGLLSIESSEPLHVRFRVKERGGPTTALGNLLVEDGQPPTVATFGLRALPPRSGAGECNDGRRRAEEGDRHVVFELKENYVEPATAQQMADALNMHESKGDYEAISDGDAFAARLTRDLQAVSHDRHLRVDFSPFKIPPRRESTTEDEARFHQQMEHSTCAFDKVEILPNNIGYVKFDGFMDASAQPRVAGGCARETGRSPGMHSTTGLRAFACPVGNARQ